MDTPIYTKVKNNTQLEKMLHWADRNCIVVEPNGVTTVPYDVWSLADEGQREAIREAVKAGLVQLFVGVMGLNGVYVETEMLVNSAAAVPPPAPAPGKPQLAIDTFVETEDDHVIHAKSDTTAANRDYYRANVEDRQQAKEKLGVNGAENNGESQEEMYRSDAEHFDKLCAEKKWADALEFLKARFEDKVTFGTRAIMALKTWDAVVTKYKLI